MAVSFDVSQKAEGCVYATFSDRKILRYFTLRYDTLRYDTIRCYRMLCLRKGEKSSVKMITLKKGCVLTEPGGLQRLTFTFGRLGNIGSYAGTQGFSSRL